MDSSHSGETFQPEPAVAENNPVAVKSEPARLSPWQATVILLTLLVFVIFKVIAVFYGLLLLLILIHETGHFLAGHLCNLQLVRFRVGPVEFSRPNSLSLRRPGAWEWKGSRRSYWTSGWIAMTATQESMTRLQSRCLVYILGGPITNLVFGLMAVPIAQRATAFGAAGKLFVLGSTFIGIGNLFPFTTDGLESDGSQIWGLPFNKARREAEFFSMTLWARLAEIYKLNCQGDTAQACDGLRDLRDTLNAVIRELPDGPKKQRLAGLREVFANVPFLKQSEAANEEALSAMDRA